LSHYIEPLLVVCGRLRHPGAKDRLKRVRGVVGPVIVDLDLRKAGKKEGSTR
jgi:hypothetical protein